MLQPKYFFHWSLFSFFTLILFACNQEDVESVEIRDVQTQFEEDDTDLLSFLQTHFYNYEDFVAAPDDYNLRIQIDTLAGENAGYTPLIDQVRSKQIEITNSDGQVIDHTLYYLVVREGKGQKPSEVDSTYVRYTGRLLDGAIFDSRELPVWFNLPDVVPGFREGIPEFRSGSFQENADGTYTFFDYGQGALFIPSGLGYYASSQPGIPAYSPLVFTFSLFVMKATDHDGDSVLSAEEDINQDGNPFNDDTDRDGTANMYDSDDDGDGVPTRDEIDRDENGVPGDSDGDGTPNYLDPDSAT